MAKPSNVGEKVNYIKDSKGVYHPVEDVGSEDIKARLSAVEKVADNNNKYMSTLGGKMTVAEGRLDNVEDKAENAETKLEGINSGEGYIEIGDVIVMYGRVTKTLEEIKAAPLFTVKLPKKIDINKTYTVNVSSKQVLTDSEYNLLGIGGFLDGDGTQLDFDVTYLNQRMNRTILSVDFCWSVIGTKAVE